MPHTAPYVSLCAIFFLIISHLDNHTTTDIIPEMLSGDYTGNRIPHYEYNIHGIVHVYKLTGADRQVRRQEGRQANKPTYY